jgi:2-keto-4-pentenoate hydratase/2-oxohepta-3-ene-1,7-dioic acid hydratase in catechol pathway
MVNLRLVSFRRKGARLAEAGAMLNDGESILSIGGELRRKKMTMLEVVNMTKHGGSTEFLKSIRERVKNGSYDANQVFSTSQVQVSAPIIPPRNVMCVGKNYTDHVAEVNQAHARKTTGSDGNEPAPVSVQGPKWPVFFTKAPETVIGPHPDKIESHKKITKWLDYEVELAVIIGKKGRDICKEDAFGHIFGYSVGNDVTAREVQKRHNQWFKGKSLDNSCPLGPCIVPHFDLIDCGADPANLRVTTHVNGDLRQDSRTSKLIFDIPTIIASLSQGFTLQPGDVILTGTPDGVGFAMVPPRVLTTGDEVVCTVEHVGALRNFVGK